MVYIYEYFTVFQFKNVILQMHLIGKLFLSNIINHTNCIKVNIGFETSNNTIF